MKRFVLLAGLLFVLTMGCSKKEDNPLAPSSGDTTAAATKVDEAVSALEKKDITSANKLFEEALKADPNNLKARMGAAVTGAGILFNDAEFQSLAKDILGASYDTSGFPKDANGILTPKNPNSVMSPLLVTRVLKISSSVTASRIQGIIENKIIPIMDKALDHLAKIEAKSDFTFIINTQISKADKPIVLDLGEVYALESILYGFKALCLETIAYNIDCNLSTIETTDSYNPFTDSNYKDFGKLRDVKYPKNSRLAWISACDKVIAGINFVKNSDTDNATDGGIRLEGANTQEIIDGANKVKSCLQGTAQTVASAAGNVQVNLYDFLETPIEDLDPYANTSNTASFVLDSTGRVWDLSNTYDFALSGLFPGMSKDSFHKITEWPWYSYPGNTVPAVTIVPAKKVVIIGETITIAANATDADGDTFVSYEWSGWSGTFSSKSTQQITWTAPNYPNSYGYYISVRVKDSRGGIGSASVPIIVTAN